MTRRYSGRRGVEQGKLIEKGAVLRRVRIDAELKREVARASETARMKGGKAEAAAARVEKAAELGLPVKAGKVEYPDAQLEYDLDGRSGRVNVEIATEHLQRQEHRSESGGGFRRAWKQWPGGRRGWRGRLAGTMATAAGAVEARTAIPPHLNSKENSCSPGKSAWD